MNGARRAAICLLIGWCGLFAAAELCAQESRGPLLARLSQRLRGRDVERATLGGVPVAIWRPAHARGPAPLVVFSHGLHGTATQSTFLMRALAERDYLVIAPDHRDSLRGLARGAGSWKAEAPLGQPDTWTEDTHRDRRDDVQRVIEALRRDAAWRGRVDWTRLALAGHSLGAYTALGLAGAWPSWKLPGIRAVLALSPYASPFARQRTLAGVAVPVMYQSGTRDPGVTPFLVRRGGVFDQTSAPAYLVVLEGANHFSFSDLGPASHGAITAYSLAFLDRHVNGDARADPARRLAGVAELKVK